MRSDWDDAPARARQRGPRKDMPVGRVLAGLVIAGVVAFGFVRGFDGAQLKLPWKTASVKAAERPVATATELPVAATRQQLTAPQQSAEELFWEQERAAQQARPSGRQTSFSDSNYTPSGHINLIASTGGPPRREPEAAAPRFRVQGLTGTGTARVVWKDARGRLSSWQTSYAYRNGTIDNHSFCLGLGKGSIDYRNCRKGAHDWLREQCRSDRSISVEWRDMYCHAQSSFRT